MMEGFWMVVGIGTPTHRHKTLMSARTEAERLARLYPWQEFVVLKSVSRVQKSEVQWTAYTWTDEDGTIVPF